MPDGQHLTPRPSMQGGCPAGGTTAFAMRHRGHTRNSSNVETVSQASPPASVVG